MKHIFFSAGFVAAVVVATFLMMGPEKAPFMFGGSIASSVAYWYFGPAPRVKARDRFFYCVISLLLGHAVGIILGGILFAS